MEKFGLPCWRAFVKLVFVCFVFSSRLLAEESYSLLFGNLTDPKNRSGVYAAPPQTYKIRVQAGESFVPSKMILAYDDLFGGLEQTLPLLPIGNGLYEGSLELQASPSTPDGTGKENENFYPRNYRFKRIDFIQTYCQTRYQPLSEIDPTIWDKCLNKEPFKGGWLIHSKNENGYTMIWVKDFSDLNKMKGGTIRVKFPPMEGGVSEILHYKNWNLFPCTIGPIPSYIHADNLEVAVRLSRGANLSCSVQTHEESYSPSLNLETDIKVTPLAPSLQKISDDPNFWRPIPRLDDIKLIWNGKETKLEEGESPAVKKENGPLKILWKMRDPFPQIKPLAVHLNLFRPTATGKTLLDSSGETQYLDQTPPQTNWSNENWQEWTLPEDEFSYVGNNLKADPGFRSGSYELKLLSTNFAANSIDKNFSFRVLGETPKILVSQAKRKSSQELEISFSTKSINTRFDVQCATSQGGPFYPLTPDVIDNPPSQETWVPYGLPLEERFEFFSQETQTYTANLLKIRELTHTFKLPEKLTFKFRAVDEVGNTFIGDPIELTLEKKDRDPPILTVEQSGNSIPIRDFGNFTALKGTLKDSSPWGNKNMCQILLEWEGLTLSSATLPLGENSLTNWSLSIPESMETLLPNGMIPVTLRVIDMDGNEKIIPLTLEVNVIPFDLKISTPFYSRSYEINSSGQKTALVDFRAQVKENSFLSLSLDGETYLKDLFTGSDREISMPLSHPFPLKKEPHKALATLQRNNEIKSIEFDWIVDNSIPKIDFVKNAQTGENLQTLQENGANIFSAPSLTLKAKGSDPDSPITLFYALGESPEEVFQQLQWGASNIFGDSLSLELPQNRPFTLGVMAKDAAGNSSTPQIYPLFYDTDPTPLEIQSIEQNSSNRFQFEVHFKPSPGELIPARYDLSVSTSSNGPWTFLTRNILEESIPKSPWSWNELLKETEWQNIRKLSGDTLPFAFNIQTLQPLVNTTDFPQEKSLVSFNFRARTQDFAGNTYTSLAQNFLIPVDLRPPVIEMEPHNTPLIDFDARGGTIYGRATDEPRENSSLKIQLMKNGTVLAETFTNEHVGGEFSLSLSPTVQPFLPNGLQTLWVRAYDNDGNKTEIPIEVTITVKPFEIEVGDSLTQRLVRNGASTYGALELDFPVVPNAQLTFSLDGKELLKNFNSGPTQQFKQTLPLSYFLENGPHSATLTLCKNGQQLSKLFTLNLSRNSSNPLEAPELFVQGSAGTVPIYDVGSFGGLYGTVKDRPYETGNTTQIFLEKDSVVLATTTLRAETDSSIPWELIIPESARNFLGSGEQNLTIVALDADGNESRVLIRANVDIRDFFVEIEDPSYTRSDNLYDHGKKSSLDLKASVKENSELSLEIDGIPWVNGIGTANRRNFEEHFESNSPLSEGAHQAILTLRRNKESIKKKFVLMVDNSSPKIILDKEMGTTLSSSTLSLNGRVEFKTPIELFTVSVTSAGEKLSSIPIQQQFHFESGSFTILLQNLPENKEKPLQLELTARNIRGENCFRSFSFFVDTTPPKPPTLKVSGRTQEALFLEGKSEADPTLSVLITDGKGNFLGKSQVYFQPNDSTGSWNLKLENLIPGDYELFATAQDLAGNRSKTVGPEKVTILKNSNSKPTLADITQGNGFYTLSNRPVLTGYSPFNNFLVQIFETGNYLGATSSDPLGNFQFTPQENLTEGWKNFVAVIYDANGQRIESAPLQFYLTTNNAPGPSKASPKDILVQNQWDLRFSPNNDGINDTLLFGKEDLPVTIQPFRRQEIIKTITEQDNDRWNGTTEDGSPCEINLYLARTKSGKEIVISLYR